MAKRIDFYTISLHNGEQAVNYPIRDFLETIGNRMGDATVVREIGEKWIRAFPYSYSSSRQQFVIPFGKLKDKNKPYWLNDENHLEEIPASLYDINSLGFDQEYNVMVFTTNREGPSVRDVEDYLNTFIPSHTGLFVRIDPIRYNTGIEKVRNAELVKKVTLYLDLGRSLNDFYLNELEYNTPRPLAEAFRAFTEAAKDTGDSKVLSLTLGLGKNGKREDTLNLESLLYLLEHINIGAEFVKEIEVNYKEGREDKIDKAKLKESNLLLSYPCSGVGSQVSPEDLLNNINNAVADKVMIITRHNREYFANMQQYNANGFNIVETWNSIE
ncbi:DUF6731 family protein [Novisyntrophococcus fermenticellae]|uniref:DUF6731 family protein n=1 Tax=Novisyntrophococcus fermenticellae TaxID=2068655 RepID=UPI001E319180|nr:DUF6731 family protein [Novisyntrophococcus fermenticellae]